MNFAGGSYVVRATVTRPAPALVCSVHQQGGLLRLRLHAGGAGRPLLP